jgi:hypothetical protein
MQLLEKLTAIDKLLHERTQLTKQYNGLSARGICSPEKNKIKSRIKEIDEILFQYRIKDPVLKYTITSVNHAVLPA